MAHVNFYLLNASEGGKDKIREVSVYLFFTDDAGNRHPVKTPLRILPKRWDKIRKKAKPFPGSVEFNQDLEEYASQTMQVYRNLRAKPVVGWKEEIRKVLTGMPGDEKADRKDLPDFFSVYDTFVEHQKKFRARRTVQKYNTLKTKLEELSSDVTFDGIDMNFYDTFVSGLLAKGMLNDTIGKYVSNLKTFMEWALERGYHSTIYYKKFAAARAAKNEIVTLDEEEFNELEKADLSKNGKLDRVRDLFCFGVYTGQRWSDVEAYHKDQIIDACWVFEAEKTRRKKKYITVPFVGFAARALDILKKYDYELPVISNQKFNKYLKELGEELKIDKTVTIRRFSGSEEIVISKPKYTFMSSHMARRTCVTLLIKKGVPLPVIQQLTGHADIKTLMKYSGIGLDALRSELERIAN